MTLQSALEHHQAGRIVEAVQLYERILQQQPDNADALHLMGNAAGQLGDADLSAQLLTRANTLAPANTSYLLSLGKALRAKRDYAASLECYARVLKLDPASASAFFGIGNTLQADGRYEEAAQNFARALEISPGFVEARYNLANLYKTCGRHEQAIEHYRLAVAAKPDLADAYHNMGGALHALGRLDEALASYQQALWRNLPETHSNMGNVHAAQGKTEEALACYERAVAAGPRYAEGYNNQGVALRKLGREKEARAAFDTALQLAPGHAVAHLNLGDWKMDEGLAAEAATHYERAIASMPANAQAHFSLGIAKSQLNDLPAAATCFEQAIAHRPGYIDAIYNLGVVAGRLGFQAQAERHYREVLAIAADHVDAQINLSAILLDSDREKEARRYMDLAYARKNVFAKHYPGADKTVLILFDAGKGNLNLSHLVNEKTNNIIDWMIEYADDAQAGKLPHYDVVFNAMGDPDITGSSGRCVSRFIQECKRPLLNHPDRVARTARDRLPALLEGIDATLVPPLSRLADEAEWNTLSAGKLPLLLRPVHTHGGIGVMLARTMDDVARFRESHQGPAYASSFIDYRSADGFFRKYRIIFIDREPYPYHLAISPNWMVHYYTAEMEEHPWKLDEEREFLRRPAQVLGAAGMAAIREIGARMDLDYAGIDFSLTTDGKILVFEANPTMLVHPEKPNSPTADKNLYVDRILGAFEALLHRSAAAA